MVSGGGGWRRSGTGGRWGGGGVWCGLDVGAILLLWPLFLFDTVAIAEMRKGGGVGWGGGGVRAG